MKLTSSQLIILLQLLSDDNVDSISLLRDGVEGIDYDESLRFRILTVTGLINLFEDLLFNNEEDE